MKTTGRYEPTECDYDLDHEINRQCDNMKIAVIDIDYNLDKENRTAILKAMAQTIIEMI